MFERIQRSWNLTREAWQLLRQDRELVWFPILSGIFSLLALASFAIPIVLLVSTGAVSLEAMAEGEGESLGGQIIGVGLTFLFYLVTYFIVVFFNSGLVACVRIRLAGGDPTVRDGLHFARANIGRIFQWALLAATVGMVLKLIEERLSWVGQIVINLIGLVWSLATTFVVPVLVHEAVGPMEAVKRSAQVFKRTWGETVVANVGMGAVFMVLFLLGLVPMALGISLAVASPNAFGVGVMLAILVGVFAYWVALAIVQSALQGIFLTACYQYAVTGEVPSGFSQDYIVEAWRPKGKKRDLLG